MKKTKHLALLVILGHALAANADPAATSGRVFDRHGIVMAQSVSIDEIIFDRSHPEAKHNAEALTAAGARTGVIIPRIGFSSTSPGTANETVISIELKSDEERKTFASAIANTPGIVLRKRIQREYPIGAAVAKNLENRLAEQADGKSSIDIHTSIDGKLQLASEQAFGGRSGAVVALDPKTGEILALVSMLPPGGSHRNLAITGGYAPGSTLKPFLALGGLELGLRKAEDEIADTGTYQYGEYRFSDSRASGHGRVNLHRSIVASCDTYYYGLADEMGIDSMDRFLEQFGFGRKTGIDLNDETAGILPSPAWKAERFKGKFPWFSSETTSVGIGEGYFQATPIQLASAVAMLANGSTLPPRLVTSVTDTSTGKSTITEPSAQQTLAIKPMHLAAIRNAMIAATRQGAAKRSFADADYQVAGKTGSSPVNALGKDGRLEAKKDHSLFIGYAPANNPKIALAVVVEAGGYGYQSAAPIARAIFDQYLEKKYIRREIQALPELKNSRVSD
jgi:cell division protein FtsI/penicillin-binding protein 2